MDSDKKGSEAAPGTSQNVTNNFNGPMNFPVADSVSLGSIENRRIEGQGSSSQKRSRPVDIDELDCTDLKKRYSTVLCKAAPLPWCHQYTWDIDEVYTKLALQKSATSNFVVEELFNHANERFKEGESYRILIEGDAGYGKSTLMLKIASDWSKSDSNGPSNYASPFGLLFVVKLGYVGEDGNLWSYMEEFYYEQISSYLGTVYDEKNLSGAKAAQYEKMGNKLKDILQTKGAEKVLILLDGYDEANANTKKEVCRIMKKEKMSKCHVVLTSRCGYVPDDVKGNALLVTVGGFGRRQVIVAVCKFFIKAGHLTKADVISCFVRPVSLGVSDSDGELGNSIGFNIDDFKNVPDINPLLPDAQRLSLEQVTQFVWKVRSRSPYKELAQCPLLCVMMCCLVIECENRELPSTRSGLYFAMINRNLYRAAIKKAKAAGKEDVKWNWNWSVLDSRIRQGHESYLEKFGRLCIDRLKTRSMSFTLFELTGNEEVAETTNVTPLIEAGVLVQDFTKLNTEGNIPCYQVPHRTTAEFLAAYCLSREKDQDLLKQNLVDLFRLRASFDEVALSLIDMGKSRCLVDAFRVIKFPSDCLYNFLESYFTQHGAAGTWSEFELALPSKLTGLRELCPVKHERNVYRRFSVYSDKPSLTLLQVVEELGKKNSGKTNETYTVPVNEDEDRLVSLHDEHFDPEMLSKLLKSGVGLYRLDLDVGRIERKSVEEEYEISEVACILQKLLKANSCPVRLSFRCVIKDLLPAVIEAMQEVPEDCRLKSLDFFPDLYDTSLLSEVLAKKWLSHLQHLGLGSWGWEPSYGLNPILKRLKEPGCSLISLHLAHNRSFDTILLEDLMMLTSKLETLRLENMNLRFDVTRISKYAVKEKCSLKSLHLKFVSLTLVGLLPLADENKELLLAWRNMTLNLEELTIDECEFPVELFSWLNLSIPNLRTVKIGEFHVKTPNNGKEFYANQLLEALTRSSENNIEDLSLTKSFWESDSIEDLSLTEFFWESNKVLMLHPIREVLQRCPRMKRVNLGISAYSYESVASVGPDPSTSLSFSDIEALKSKNIYLALFKIILSFPNLQTITSEFYFKYWEEIGTFDAIADKAKNWSGKRNDSKCNSSLTLHGLSSWSVCNAMHVFRQRGLKYCLRYVSDKVYELWFPCKSNI